MKTKESWIFGAEIFIFVRFVIGSVYTVYGRFYENLPNFDVANPSQFSGMFLKNIYNYVCINED